MEHTEYRNIIRGREIRDLFSFQRLLEKREVEKAVSLKRGDPLGIGVGLSFIWSKEVEVVNLRTIAYGIHFNIPRREIREDLII